MEYHFIRLCELIVRNHHSYYEAGESVLRWGRTGRFRRRYGILARLAGWVSGRYKAHTGGM